MLNPHFKGFFHHHFSKHFGVPSLAVVFPGELRASMTNLGERLNDAEVPELFAGEGG